MEIMKNPVPHTCPVCGGRGSVSEDPFGSGVTSACGRVTCRACQGSGIVWGPTHADADFPEVI